MGHYFITRKQITHLYSITFVTFRFFQEVDHNNQRKNIQVKIIRWKKTKPEMVSNGSKTSFSLVTNS